MKAPQLTGNRCQCTVCGDYFGSVRGFDRHRIGPIDSRACLPAAALLASGWQRNARGFLLTPDPRRAGAGAEGACRAVGATTAGGAA